MTHEEFKQICLNEYPKIEAMVKTVKALGVAKVSCTVYANGTINFDIAEKEKEPAHSSWHFHNKGAGWLQIVEFDKKEGVEWVPICYYDHVIDNDETVDDLPFA